MRKSVLSYKTMAGRTFGYSVNETVSTSLSTPQRQHPLPQHGGPHRRLATTVAVAAGDSTPSRLEAIRSRRSELFTAEAERQKSLASSRLEKIKIEYETEDSKKVEMWMNKALSTPRDCAMHLRTQLVRRR